MQEREITATTGHGVGTDQAPHNAVDPKSQVPDKARDPNVMSLLVSSLPSASFLGIGGTAKDASEGIMKQFQLESMKGATDHAPASNPSAAVHQAITEMAARLAGGSKESEQAARQEFTDTAATVKALAEAQAQAQTQAQAEAHAQAEAQSRVLMAEAQAQVKALAEAQAQAQTQAQAEAEARAQAEAQAQAKAQAQTEARES